MHYQGEAGPYPDPSHQYGPWQGHAGAGASPQGPMYSATRSKGLFGSLFDLNFDEMISTRLIKAFYLLAIILISLTSLFVLLVGLWALQFDWGRYFGVFLVPAAPLIWMVELVFTRMALEFLINQFKITEHLKVMREREERR